MIPLTAGQLADVVGGAVRRGSPDAELTAVVIDSRRAGPGALFVALPGEHTDGHRFVTAASAAGAAACLVADAAPVEVPPDAATAVVAVDDPADALLGLGRWVRQTVAPLVVAVTGSAGKTTTKDLAAAAIGAGRAVVANPGSFNNDLGVPLTCCGLTMDTEVLVAEVGARGPGHIAALAAWLAPDVAVVTTVGAAHLELFGDVGAVARAKAELVTALGPEGLAVLNGDDPRVAAMAAGAPGRVAMYGTGPTADWRAEEVHFDDLRRARFTVRGVPVALPLPGAHHVGNALAALAAADAVGVPLRVAATAVGSATVSPWRSELVPTAGGVTVLNDAYNANPTSTAAALETLAGMRVPGRRWAVLGRMAELGPGGVEEHVRMGALAAALGLDGVVAVGDGAAAVLRGARDGGVAVALAAADAVAALAVLDDAVGAGDAVLVKASRAEGLERLAADLVTRWGGPAAGGSAA